MLPFIDALPAENIPTFRTFFWVPEEVLADRADKVVNQVLIAVELYTFYKCFDGLLFFLDDADLIRLLNYGYVKGS